MYIKIKHLRIFFLVFSCLFFSFINYLAFASADDSDPYADLADKTDSDIATTTNPNNITAQYLDQFSQFSSSKNGQAISTADLQNFSTSFLTEKTQQITADSLPAVDIASIKNIKKQPYSQLSESDRKAKYRADAATYFQTMAYLLFSNSPKPLITHTDFVSFAQEFLGHLNSFSTSATPSDMQYFSDLGSRLETFLSQTDNVEVPETMLDLHVKFLRIVKGILTLRIDGSPSSDPVAAMIIFSNMQNYCQILADFFQVDITNYIKQIAKN